MRVLQHPSLSTKLNAAAKARLSTDFDWAELAAKTITVYERVWSEFLDSYWADRTVWPVTPGAEDRAKELDLERKAETGVTLERHAIGGGALQPGPIGLATIADSDVESEEDYWTPAF